MRKTVTRRALLGTALTLSAVLGPLATTTATATAEPVPPARLSLAAPTGPLPVGSTQMHLADPKRPDPWVPGEKRELMTTVWYPATPGGGPPAPYVGSRLAAYLDETSTPGLGLKPGQVDWAGIGTHARADAPLARGRGARPVLLYSPGALESRAYGSGAAADLASHGYVVVTMDHTYETPVDFPDRLAPQRTTPQDGVRKLDEIRTADVRTVLDKLGEWRAGRNPDADGKRLPAGLGRALDLNRIGMFGHSAGGDVAVQAMSEDRRIDAAADMDGFLGYDWLGRSPLPAARDGVDRPVLLLGSQSTAAAEPPPGQDADWILRTHHSNPAWASLWAHSTGPKLDLGVPLGRHHVFTDHQSLLPQLAALGVPAQTVSRLLGTNPEPERVLASLHTYLTAFFDRHLRGLPRPVLDGPSPRHPDISFVR